MFRVEDCAEDIWLDRGGDTNYIATIWKDDCARHGIDPAELAREMAAARLARWIIQTHFAAIGYPSVLVTPHQERDLASQVRRYFAAVGGGE